MAIEVFNRIEHKYIIDTVTYRKVLEAMAPHMTPDRYNRNLRPYTIANIYYDTPDDYLIRNSLSKPAYKEKLRLRSYGLPTLDTEVFLEIKKKVGGIVNKRRTPIRLSDAYAFIATGAPPTSSKHLNEQVVNEISYFLTFYSLCPKLYLAYDRVAFLKNATRTCASPSTTISGPGAMTSHWKRAITERRCLPAAHASWRSKPHWQNPYGSPICSRSFRSGVPAFQNMARNSSAR